MAAARTVFCIFLKVPLLLRKPRQVWFFCSGGTSLSRNAIGFPRLSMYFIMTTNDYLYDFSIVRLDFM